MKKITSNTRQRKAAVRKTVKGLLTRSAAFSRLPPGKQAQIEHDTVAVVDYLVSPARQASGGARKLTQQVDFPAFVSSLIKDVFQAIVDTSIEQMKAYGKLIAAVAKSLDKFSDENISDNEARDYLEKRFPDLFTASTAKAKPATIKRLAKERRELLREVLLMGINRIVVTSGTIKAKVGK